MTVAVAVLGVAAERSAADVPLAQRVTWSGSIDFFATGAPMAVDGSDADTTMVDQLAQPATVNVSSVDVPSTATLVRAFLYWSGSITNDDCATTANIDDTVTFAPPGATAPAQVVATVCYCSDGGASSYDMQVCRADVTAVIAAATTVLSGDYVVDGFAAHITNAATDTASFSLVLVYTEPSLPPRRIGLYDGVLTMSSAVNTSEQITLGGIEIDNPAQGDLTWYTLEGDVGGTGVEQVTVSGAPGAASLVLSDAVNPGGNPMNHTINTVSPPRNDTLGVDIDRFDISSALTPGDTAVDMLYEAGTDKWWIAYNIVGVNVSEVIFKDGFESAD